MNFTEPPSNLSRAILHWNLNVTTAEILGNPLHITLLVLHGLQGAIAIVANLFTIIAVIKFRFLWEDNACRFVASLSCADLLAGIAVVSDIILNSIDTQPSVFIHLCRFKLLLHFLSILGNLYNILFVMVNRFIYIHIPLRYYSIVTQRKTSIVIVVLWVAIFIQMSVLLIMNKMVNVNMPCNILYVVGNSSRNVLIIQAFTIICIVSPCHATILWTAEQQRKNEPHISNFPAETRSQQIAKIKQRTMAWTVGIISAVFILSYVPVMIFNMVVAKLSLSTKKSFAVVLCNRILKIILWTQSMANPFIYSWRIKPFRRAYAKLLLSRQNKVAPKQVALQAIFNGN